MQTFKNSHLLALNHHGIEIEMSHLFRNIFHRNQYIGIRRLVPRLLRYKFLHFGKDYDDRKHLRCWLEHPENKIKFNLKNTKMRDLNSTKFKMTNQVLCKMTNHTLKMTDLLAPLNSHPCDSLPFL